MGEQGIGLQKLVLHVYNLNNTLFEKADLETIRRNVVKFIKANSKDSSDLVERTRRGVYRLNPHSPKLRQLMLSFGQEPEEPQPQAPADLGPTLFD